MPLTWKELDERRAEDRNQRDHEALVLIVGVGILAAAAWNFGLVPALAMFPFIGAWCVWVNGRER